MASLQGKTALVTGASRGIGRATGLAIAAAGAHVLVHYGRSAPEAESLVSEIQAKGGRANAISANLGIPDGAALLAKQVRSIVADRFGCACAQRRNQQGGAHRRLHGRGLRQLVCYSQPVLSRAATLPILGEGSNIIVISSIGAHAAVGKPSLDNPSILAYASTKGALETLVKNWAAVLGPRGNPTEPQLGVAEAERD